MPPLADTSALAAIMQIRQGSNELDSSCSRERSSPVMLSAAKHLAADRDRPFAALRVTWCDESNCQGLFFTIEPCLNKIIRRAEKPARPINRRWPRYIGPYGWPEYFVKEHNRALRLSG